MNKEKVIEKLKKIKEKNDINAEEYDGSYELVRKTVELLGQTDNTKLDYKDLDMLYLMTIGTWQFDFEHKKGKVKESNLSEENKDKLIKTLEKVEIKSKNSEYRNFDNSVKDSQNIGMFGTGFYTFKRGNRNPSKNAIKKFINMCVRINENDVEENCINIAEKNLKNDIYGLGTASLSQILHCLKPKIFPILNNKGIELYHKLGLNLEKPHDITYYPKNTKTIKKFRDENFDFENYRIIDEYAFTNFDESNENEKNENSNNKVEDDEEKDYNQEINYWKIIAGKNAEKWEDFNSNNYVAFGWDKVNYKEGNLLEQIKNNYPERSDRSCSRIKNYFDYFFEEMDEGDIVVIYGKGKINIGKINSDYYIKDKGLYKNRRKVKWLLKSPVLAENYGTDFYNKMRSQYTITTIINDEFIDIINKILKEKSYDKNIVNETTINKDKQDLQVDLDKNLDIENLYFPQKQKANLINRISTNLKNGKHIILTGPPGTGKSKLAKEIASNYIDDNYKMVTATSDWSTFDTIGGYRPDREGKLEFCSGVFLDCYKNDNTPANNWLLIDEINRADIDKAFGSLFSALTGDPITLSFKNKDDKNIEIIPEEIYKNNNKEKISYHNEYIIPKDWRIIATMNTFDKTSLYEMSYAFMRRFAFIPVDIPENISFSLVEKYLKYWNIENGEYIADVSDLWNKINEVREIGPAIVEDIYKYLLSNPEDYVSPIISYVLPQFEGIRKDDIISFIDSLVELSFIDVNDKDAILQFSNSYFRLGS